MNNNTVSANVAVTPRADGQFDVASPIGTLRVNGFTERHGSVTAYVTIDKAIVKGRPCHGHGDATRYAGGSWGVGLRLHRDDVDAFGRARFLQNATPGQCAAVRAVVEAALPMIWRDHRAEIERANVESEKARKRDRILECRAEIAKLEKEILALG